MIARLLIVILFLLPAPVERRIVDYSCSWYNYIMSHQGMIKYLVKDAPLNLGGSKSAGFSFAQRMRKWI